MTTSVARAGDTAMGETRRRARPMSAPGRPAAADGLGAAWPGRPPAEPPPSQPSSELVEVTLGRPAGPAFAPPSHVPTLSTFSGGRSEGVEGRAGHQRALSQPAPPPRTALSERQPAAARPPSEGPGPPAQRLPGEQTPRRSLSERPVPPRTLPDRPVLPRTLPDRPPRTLPDRSAAFRTLPLPERPARSRELSEGQPPPRRTLSAGHGPAWDQLERRLDEVVTGVDLMPPEYSIRLLDEPVRYIGPEPGRLLLLEPGDSPLGAARPPDPFQVRFTGSATGIAGRRMTDPHDAFSADVGADQGYAADDEYEEQTVKQMLRR
ncbi:hypothetical protein FJT64_020473 [Amphibalanus amphitrite]|uniref:Uncharacterized protein n=1 Tax=Amphibalanus amphitrite TaxID=1232801 RepID=A0A6A4WWQ7_AMPAM|nr:hypothetical protein FJT64_020473 [Amphibalanus amphitrite]